jgi:hypothetical protein
MVQGVEGQKAIVLMEVLINQALISPLMQLELII